MRTRGFAWQDALAFLFIVFLVSLFAFCIFGMLMSLRSPSEGKETVVIVSPKGEAEKSPSFHTGQEVVKVPRNDLEKYLSGTKKRVVSVCPMWVNNEKHRPSYYLVVLE